MVAIMCSLYLVGDPPQHLLPFTQPKNNKKAYARKLYETIGMTHLKEEDKDIEKSTTI